jgi:hypothetical membrane protein
MQYSIAMYQDWKVERNTVSEVGQMIKRYITNGSVEQMAVLTIDY